MRRDSGVEGLAFSQDLGCCPEGVLHSFELAWTLWTTVLFEGPLLGSMLVWQNEGHIFNQLGSWSCAVQNSGS